MGTATTFAELPREIKVGICTPSASPLLSVIIYVLWNGKN